MQEQGLKLQYTLEENGRDIILRNVNQFNLMQTLECGQCFHFKKLAQQEYGIAAYSELLHIKQIEADVILYNTTKEKFETLWKQYFDLETDYQAIQQFILKKDSKLKQAIETMGGVRILKQEFFEILISFIISQNKQIPHIKQIVATISEKYGKFLGEIQGEKFYSFPDPNTMAEVTVEELKECKTGFRAPYIHNAVEKVCANEVVKEKLISMNNEDCMKNLMTIKGVGEKIANCVMLFGLGKTDAFPIDVWIKRIMEYMYFGKETSKEEMAWFAKERFGKYGGYAQQYLFYYGRENKIGLNKTKNK